MDTNDIKTDNELNATEKNSNEEETFSIVKFDTHLPWFQTPNFIVDYMEELNLGPYEFTLYSIYLRIAGSNGACWKSNKKIAKQMGCSIRKLIECKKSLATPRSQLKNRPLIFIKKRFNNKHEKLTDEITIVNFLKPNVDFKDTKDRLVVTNDNYPSDARSHKEDLIKEDLDINILSSKKKEKKQTSKNIIENVSADAYDVSEYLLKKLLKNNPEIKKPKIDSWAKDIDKAIRLDNRSTEGLKDVIDWMFDKDQFWRLRIRSGNKLREHFDVLYESMIKNQPYKIKTTITKSCQQNKQWCENLKKSKLPENIEIRIEDNCLCINNRGEFLYIGYNEKLFKQITIKTLNKVGVDISNVMIHETDRINL